jgi:SAM-dependent methyltransferase
VLATDMSPIMVERVTAHARNEGLTNLQARVMDGQSLDLADNSFDIAGSQFGVMLFPDMPRGIRELARVTKPGGRVLMVAYAGPEELEFITFFLRSIAAAAPGYNPFPGDEPPLPFQLRDPERLRGELTGAGLADVRVETINENLEFNSADDMWTWLTNSNPVGKQIVAGLTENQSDTVRQELSHLLRERSGGSGPAVLRQAVHIGTGMKR